MQIAILQVRLYSASGSVFNLGPHWWLYSWVNCYFEMMNNGPSTAIISSVVMVLKIS